MRKNGIKWVLGSLSVVAVVFSIVMITNSSYAQDDQSEEGVQIENVENTPSADMDSDKSLKDCQTKCKSECAEGECTNCTKEECESMCKSLDAEGIDFIEKGGC